MSDDFRTRIANAIAAEHDRQGMDGPLYFDMADAVIRELDRIYEDSLQSTVFSTIRGALFDPESWKANDE